MSETLHRGQENAATENAAIGLVMEERAARREMGLGQERPFWHALYVKSLAVLGSTELQFWMVEETEKGRKASIASTADSHAVPAA